MRVKRTVPLTIELRERQQGKICVHTVKTLHKQRKDTVTGIIPNLPKSIDRCVLPPDHTIWCQPEGMTKNCATDRRYHDVDDARMDETRDLLSQLRTVFSIVGK